MAVPECPGCRELTARLAQAEAKLLKLEAIIRDLEERLKRPAEPRPITPQAPAPAKKPTGRKPGAQPGHPSLVKPERVNPIVPYVPESCSKCKTALPQSAAATDPEPKRHPVAELPPMAAVITEHQAHARTCPCCGETTWATIPAEIRAHSVGPTMTGFIGVLSGKHGMSKRDIEELIEESFEGSIALGTIANREQELSVALAPAHEEVRKAVADAAVKPIDETGWKQAGKKRWLWTVAIRSMVYFLIHPRRNLDALKRAAGEKLAGILCSDRWCVYDDWPGGRRQLCWAQVKRNWEKKAEKGGAAKTLADAWLELHAQVFALWHRFRETTCTRSERREQMVPLRYELQQVLARGKRSRDRTLVRFCTRLMGPFQHLWTFVEVEGVEPTNHRAERVLRRAVLWRRRSFGCHSAEGCRFAERILTVVQTLREQKRSVLAFLADAITAHRAGTTAPTLQLG
jgi:transposase